MYCIVDIIFEFPSNILLRKIGARNLLSTITILWGAATLAIAFVKNWQSLVGLRVVLGFFEAGFFPGCVYLLSSWYTRWRTQVRDDCSFGVVSYLREHEADPVPLSEPCDLRLHSCAISPRADPDLVVLPDEHVHQRALSDPSLWLDPDPQGGHDSYVEVDLFGTR
jgi:hypothetical protein